MVQRGTINTENTEKKWLGSGKLAVEKRINFREDVLISQKRCINFIKSVLFSEKAH
jgi:hypothetical protein